MEDFILLGQIPGTSIHITFGGWLVIALCLALASTLLYGRHEHLLVKSIDLLKHKSKRRMLKYFDQIAL